MRLGFFSGVTSHGIWENLTGTCHLSIYLNFTFGFFIKVQQTSPKCGLCTSSNYPICKFNLVSRRQLSWLEIVMILLPFTALFSILFFTRVPLKSWCLQKLFINHVNNIKGLGLTFKGVKNVWNSEYINTKFTSKWCDIEGWNRLFQVSSPFTDNVRWHGASFSWRFLESHPGSQASSGIKI